MALEPRTWIFFRRVEGGGIQFGFDRMGAGAILSKPLPLSSSGTEELDISLGSLLPPADSAVFAQFPSFATMRNEVYLRFNGVVALRRVPRCLSRRLRRVGSRLAPIQSEARHMGRSFAERSPRLAPSAPKTFPESERIFPRSWIVRVRRGPASAGLYAFGSYFRMEKRGLREPLLSSGKKGASDTLFVQYETVIPRSGLVTPDQGFHRCCREPFR